MVYLVSLLHYYFLLLIENTWDRLPGVRRTGGCIETQQQLRDAIQNNLHVDFCRPPRTKFITELELSSEIDITGKSFSVSCPHICERCSSPVGCSIRSTNENGMFSGAPLDAQFDSISFTGGKADNGGVLLLTGGSATFSSSEFRFNEAREKGGAFHVSGSSAVLSVSVVGADYNQANSGAFLYAEDGATVTITASAPFEGYVDHSYGTFNINYARELGGIVAAFDGSEVRIEGLFFDCTNQAAKMNGDYIYIEEGASVECVDIQVSYPGTIEPPGKWPPQDSALGLVGASDTCAANKPTGDSLCKRPNEM